MTWPAAPCDRTYIKWGRPVVCTLHAAHDGPCLWWAKNIRQRTPLGVEIWLASPEGRAAHSRHLASVANRHPERVYDGRETSGPGAAVTAPDPDESH